MMCSHENNHSGVCNNAKNNQITHRARMDSKQIKYMHPVKFKRFIARCYEKEFSGYGWFLHWGFSCENSTGINIALIETPDGTIEETPANKVKFVNLQLTHKYRIMGIFKGFQIDEIVTAENRETAIEIMAGKYPDHVFEYISELM